MLNHHGGEVLEIRPGEDERFEHIGAAVDRLQRGIDHLRQRLHNLTPDLVRYHAAGGMLGAMILFDINEDGIFLSPFTRTSRLDSFRGYFLRFGPGKNTIIAFARTHVAPE